MLTHEKEKHMTISTDTKKKVFNKFNMHSFRNKTLRPRNRREHLQPNKRHLYNIAQEALANIIRQEKEIKGIKGI